MQLIRFLQQVPAAFYLASTVGLITATATLLGVWATNKANHKRLNLELTSKQAEKDKERALNNLEELYTLSRQMTSEVFFSCRLHSEAMDGQMSLAEVINAEAERAEKDKNQFHRIHMLVDLYFPELKPARNRMNEAYRIAMEILLTHRDTSPNLLTRKVSKDVLKQFLLAQSNFYKESGNFIEAISEQSTLT